MAQAPKTYTHRFHGVEMTITCEPCNPTAQEIAGALSMAMTLHIQDQDKLQDDITKQAQEDDNGT
jgi:hypothetical protein